MTVGRDCKVGTGGVWSALRGVPQLTQTSWSDEVNSVLHWEQKLIITIFSVYLTYNKK